MLPASDLSEILANLSALNLQPNTAAQILAAVLAPLLRSSDPDPPEDLPRQRASRPRVRLRRTARRKKPKHRAAATPAVQNEHSGRNAPRQRAIAALKANPGASLTAVAKLAGVSRSTVVNAARELAAEARREARKQARREARKASATPKPATERRQRAQRFLNDTLAGGPKRVTDVEEAAAKAHVDPQTLEQARADLGIVTTRANTGGAHAVQWSLPG
jgi:transposase